MTLQVTGKNIDVGEAFQAYAEGRLEAAIGKYVGRHLFAHVRVEKERGRFLTHCTVRLHTGLILEASGEGTEAYASADNAFERLEKRLRRYKRRLTSHHHHGAAADRQAISETLVNDYVVQLPLEGDIEGDEATALDGTAIGGDGPDNGWDNAADTIGSAAGAGNDNPLVIAETERALRDLAVSDAVMQLDLTDEAFLVFRNAANGTINVVYRRPDGNVGWIDSGSRSSTQRDGT